MICCKMFERLTATHVFLNTTLKQGSGETWKFKADFCQTFNARIVALTTRDIGL